MKPLYPIRTFLLKDPRLLNKITNTIKEFSNKPEFDVSIIDIYINEEGFLDAWETLKNILLHKLDQSEELIILCNHNHKFSDSYDDELLYKNILIAQSLNSDILIGGSNFLSSIFEVSESLIWIEGFKGMQFVVLFRSIFNSIINYSATKHESVENKISILTKLKFAIYPFISVQADVSKSNDRKEISLNYIEDSNSLQKATRYLLDIQSFYTNRSVENEKMLKLYELSGLVIPVYVINLPQRTDRLEHIQGQLENRSEFEVHYVEAIKHNIGAVGLWKSIIKVVDLAISNEDDVIIICEDDHLFTKYYCKERLIKNILKSHFDGVDILSGGINNGFNYAAKVDEDRFWVDHFYGTQFIVIYRRMFEKIKNTPYDDTVTADDFLSLMTNKKMVLYPFISRQQFFGYSDISPRPSKVPETFATGFEKAHHRLREVSGAHKMFFRKLL